MLISSTRVIPTGTDQRSSTQYLLYQVFSHSYLLESGIINLRRKRCVLLCFALSSCDFLLVSPSGLISITSERRRHTEAGKTSFLPVRRQRHHQSGCFWRSALADVFVCLLLLLVFASRANGKRCPGETLSRTSSKQNIDAAAAARSILQGRERSDQK